MKGAFTPFPSAWANHLPSGASSVQEKEGVFKLAQGDWVKMLLLLALLLLSQKDAAKGELAFTNASYHECLLPNRSKGCRSISSHLKGHKESFPPWLLGCLLKLNSDRWALHYGKPSTYIMRLPALLCWWRLGEPPVGQTHACHSVCGNLACLNPLHITWGSHADNAYHAVQHKLKAQPQAQVPPTYKAPHLGTEGGVRPSVLKAKRGKKSPRFG